MDPANKDAKKQLSQVRLCVITDRALSRGRSFEDIVKAAIRGGAQMIQFRDKQLPDGEFYRQALKLQNLTSQAGVLFIIDDRVDVALSVGADGVHLGERDLPVEAARKVLGSELIVGASARTPEGVRRAQEGGADYLGVGAMFPTGTKDDATYVGIERLAQLRPLVKVPILAIGGIAVDNAAETIRAGADAVAVVSAVVAAEDVAGAARLLLKRVLKAYDQGKEKG
jgi:thiamine-phosphate pyrophosphorylase